MVARKRARRQRCDAEMHGEAAWYTCREAEEGTSHGAPPRRSSSANCTKEVGRRQRDAEMDGKAAWCTCREAKEGASYRAPPRLSSGANSMKAMGRQRCGAEMDGGGRSGGFQQRSAIKQVSVKNMIKKNLHSTMEDPHSLQATLKTHIFDKTLLWHSKHLYLTQPCTSTVT
jgi:hypothetical protein